MGLQCVECGTDLVVEAAWCMCSACLLWHRVTVEAFKAQPAIDDLRGNDYLSGHDSLNHARPPRTCGTQDGTGVTPVSQCGVEGCNGDHDATTEGVQGRDAPPAAECQRFPKPSRVTLDAQTAANAFMRSHYPDRSPRGGTPRGPSISNMHGSTDITQKIEPGMRLHCLTCGKSVSNVVPHDTVVRAVLECPECVEKDAPIPRRHRWLGVPAPCQHTWVTALAMQSGVYLGDVCTQCHQIRPPQGVPAWNARTPSR